MQGRECGSEPHRHFVALVALHEHPVFTSRAIWGIDSFDHWGVELGKVLGGALLARLEGGAGAAGRLDASTAGLLGKLGA